MAMFPSYKLDTIIGDLMVEVFIFIPQESGLSMIRDRNSAPLSLEGTS